MTVKAIEPESIFEYPHLDLIIQRLFGDTTVSDELISWMMERLLDAEDEYGSSWTGVDLRQSMQEEIVDLANYLVMGLVRRLLAKDSDPGMETIFGAVAELVSTLYLWVDNLEDFEVRTGS